MRKSASSARPENAIRWTGRVPWEQVEKKGEKKAEESGRKEGELQKAHDVAEALLEEGMEIEKIAKIVGMAVNVIREWITEK